MTMFIATPRCCRWCWVICCPSTNIKGCPPPSIGSLFFFFFSSAKRAQHFCAPAVRCCLPLSFRPLLPVFLPVFVPSDSLHTPKPLFCPFVPRCRFGLAGPPGSPLSSGSFPGSSVSFRWYWRLLVSEQFGAEINKAHTHSLTHDDLPMSSTPIKTSSYPTNSCHCIPTTFLSLASSIS